jgi:outer membrane immunogenic protein
MTMKLKVIAGAGALVWMSAVGQVLAADIPAAPVLKAPVAVAPSQSWYGFHIGLHAGYGRGSQSVNFVPDAFYLPAFVASGVPSSAAGNPKGFIGGVQWGSDWQFGRVVLGMDSDFSYTDIKSSQIFNGAVGVLPFTATTSQKMTWFGTTRLRGGVLAADNLLLYVTGGLASGHVESTANDTVTLPGACLVPGSCLSGSASKNKWGWTIGGGIELADGPWHFRAEYLHYDLGTLSYVVADPLLPGAGVAANVKFSGDIVRAAISYRFNWTPLGLIFGTDRM